MKRGMYMIKDAIEKYYERLSKAWAESNNTLPLVPYNHKVPPIVYIGVEDDEGYIGWQLVKNDKVAGFSKLNLELGFDLHSDIKMYLLSYYFMDLSGEIKDGLEVIMTPITPLTNVETFILNRNNVTIENGRDNQLIELGLVILNGNDSLLLCVDNSNGEVKWLDGETGDIEVISNSLENLINAMKPRC